MMIGLDCAPPALVFERFADSMPNLSRLRERGRFSPLRSTVPPITVPAWSSMLSGRDPGELGLYGFRNRVPGSYALRTADARQLRAERVWERAGRAGKRVCALFVPPSFPPTPVNGELVGCFLTPGTDVEHTWPDALADELSERFGPLELDVPDYRSDALPRLREQLFQMTRQHFAIARHLWQSREPELLVMVEMGPDRLHHAFWHCFDPAHPRHEPDNPFADVGRQYYALLDEELGALVALAGDDTAIVVASDHGARPMLGGICLNEWLIAQGELVLKRPAPQGVITPLSELEVDWARTRAWSDGGYYARLYLNVQGREPEGSVPPAQVPALLASLRERIERIEGPPGVAAPPHRIVEPREHYRALNGVPPELCIFFGDLAYRAIGSVGHGRHWTRDNDTGPDGCNHDWDGIFVLAGAGTRPLGAQPTCPIYDVGATIAGLLGLPPEPDLLGTDHSARDQAVNAALDCVHPRGAPP